MSSPIWTPDALQSNAQAFKGLGWRLVEAQHRVSTLKLVDNTVEQEALENILEETKPDLPAECRQLDYLLSTPFRYRPYPKGSRFRREGMTLGVWYGSERPETAVAEMVFYRFLFYAESPETPFPDEAAEYTAFSVDLSTSCALDLTSGALAVNADLWTDLTNYEACQKLAESAREADVAIIRYKSVRDPEKGENLAVLTCKAFGSSGPTSLQTWRIRISRTGGHAICEFPRLSSDFAPDIFAPDPRLEGMRWDRSSAT